MGKEQRYYASDWNRQTGFRELVIWFRGAMTFLTLRRIFSSRLWDGLHLSLSLFILGQKKGEKKNRNFHLPPSPVPHQRRLAKLSKAPPIQWHNMRSTAQLQRGGTHGELNPLADRYMWWLGLHAACIRVPVGGVECLRQASSSSDPLPTGMGEVASSWDFTLLLSVWLQILPHPTGCFSCAPHGYDRCRRNTRDPQLMEGWQGEKQLLWCGSVWVILMIYVWSLQTVYVVNDWTDPRHKRRNVSHVSKHKRLALITVSVQ